MRGFALDSLIEERLRSAFPNARIEVCCTQTALLGISIGARVDGEEYAFVSDFRNSREMLECLAGWTDSVIRGRRERLAAYAATVAPAGEVWESGGAGCAPVHVAQDGQLCFGVIGTFRAA